MWHIGPPYARLSSSSWVPHGQLEAKGSKRLDSPPPSQSPREREREREEERGFFSFASVDAMDGFGKGDDEEETKFLHARPSLLEVCCKSSGKTVRFATGTDAGFAVRMINNRLDVNLPPASHIEAVKEGEEPISFGNTAILVNYGEGWKLQTVHEDAYHELRRVGSLEKRFRKGLRTSSGTLLQEKPNLAPGFQLSFQYVGKIVLAFCFIFLIGGILTFLLENIPSLISFVSTLV